MSYQEIAKALELSVAAVKMAFSIMPILFTFDDGRVTWMMIRDVPRIAAMYWIVRVGFWAALIPTNRRLHTSGL